MYGFGRPHRSVSGEPARGRAADLGMGHSPVAFAVPCPDAIRRYCALTLCTKEAYDGQRPPPSTSGRAYPHVAIAVCRLRMLLQPIGLALRGGGARRPDE